MYTADLYIVWNSAIVFLVLIFSFNNYFTLFSSILHCTRRLNLRLLTYFFLPHYSTLKKAQPNTTSEKGLLKKKQKKKKREDEGPESGDNRTPPRQPPHHWTPLRCQGSENLLTIFCFLLLLFFYPLLSEIAVKEIWIHLNRDYRSLFFFPFSSSSSSSFPPKCQWPPAGTLSHQHVAWDMYHMMFGWFEPTTETNRRRVCVKVFLCQIENLNAPESRRKIENLIMKTSR